jgi:transcriptional regulator with GAF, ATPase, and Fis domain
MNGIPLAPTRRYFFRFNIKDLATGGQDLASLLEPLLAATRSDGAFVYRAAETADEFHAVAAWSNQAPKIPELGVTMGTAATSLLSRTTEPFQTAHAADERFANLPETLQFGIRRTVIFPLRAAEALLGFLTLGRAENEAFDEVAIQAAIPVARIAAAVLERDALQTALRERKLVERAKGILQKRRGVSEEDAYHYLRNQSRRTRRPMVEVAGSILASASGSAPLRKTA